jgi:hypothetical protein
VCDVKFEMNRFWYVVISLLCSMAPGCSIWDSRSVIIEPVGKGPYAVESTNMEVASEYVDIGDEVMHHYLLGVTEAPDKPRYLADILKYPDSAWITDVPVPEQPELYGPVSGETMPVVTFLAYPSVAKQQPNTYAFPYHDAMYGVFENMLDPGVHPRFADPDKRYPLIIIAHGANAHGIFDVGHAHSLASHGYIVAVINYGDDRTADQKKLNIHAAFLRPLLTKAVLDSILESDTFGDHIDTDNIGISGHSFGGFTSLAVMGGPVLGNTDSVVDERFSAGVIAAPWVGRNYDGSDLFAFGPDNNGLNRVAKPVISFFGTNDEASLASFILPAMKQLSGPTYVVELIDQPHVFEGGSWVDRNNWELLFFSAYLKNDLESLASLRNGRSMKGGNDDMQRFEYQKLPGIN